MPEAPDFEDLVTRHYQALYRFALSLTRSEADASDLTQQAFYLWAVKGHQLRDVTKVKTWLFTTLHREFLEKSRRHARFRHQELEEVALELPAVSADMVARLDGAAVVECLARIEEGFQAPVALFYLEDFSYKEIAEVLDIPIGTVKSRIHRGLAQLYTTLTGEAAPNRAVAKPQSHGRAKS